MLLASSIVLYLSIALTWEECRVFAQLKAGVEGGEGPGEGGRGEEGAGEGRGGEGAN